MMALLLKSYQSLLRGSAVPRRSMAAARETAGSSKKSLDLFYDVVSPYSWFGFEVVCRYRQIWNIDLHFRPVFLAGIMKATGNQPPATLPKKAEYLNMDILRVAKYYQVPVQLVSDFFGTVIQKGSLPAMRFITAVDASQPQYVEPISRELWMRIWSRDEDIVKPESILAAAEKAGLPLEDARKILEMSNSPEIKNRLKETTDQALKYGAFGLPSFVFHVNGKPQLIFGSDRLELLGSLLGEKWHGPVPTASKL
uniref:Glutathione S-transferase kappa n=1 Tax=Salvator merianae TaxID=96440 RepID=A0A8D0DNC8_SALMN